MYFKESIRMYAFLLPIISVMFPSLFMTKYLGWFDSRLISFYHLEIIYTEQKKYQIPYTQFQPYDTHMMQSSFSFLQKEKVVQSVLGGVNYYALYERINHIENKNDLSDIRKNFGSSYYDPQKIKLFDNFCKKFVSYQSNKEKYPISYLLDRLSAIHHYQAYPGSKILFEPIPFQNIQVFHNEYYFTGKEIIQYTNKPVWEIKKPED